MSRIVQAFSKKANIAYLPVGAGGKASIDYCRALIGAGVNLLEVGLPFSDPIADGPVIQESMEKSLANGVGFLDACELISDLRAESEVALLVFAYLNSLGSHPVSRLEALKRAGADGVLIVDLPFEESISHQLMCKKIGLDLVFVASPSTPLERVALLSKVGSGFLYYACRKGTTGMKKDLPLSVLNEIREVKRRSCLPVAVGFGVSSSGMVKKILREVDGCVLGSYFVNAIAEGKSIEEFERLAKEVFNVK